MSSDGALLPAAPVAQVPQYPPRIVEDLQKSGLLPGDMRIKPLSPVEKTAANVAQGADGYVIPYFSPQGNPLPFYRVKVFDNEVKYKQVQNTSNHLYFPPGLAQLLAKSPKYLLWVEGEKKAAACVKNGFPAVAVGGVDNWRNRTLVLPKDMKLAQTKSGQIAARVPAGAMVGESVDTVATGYTELVDLLVRVKVPLIIIYDTDIPTGCKPEVQRAAATLGYDLRFRGVGAGEVRQLILPWEAGDYGLRRRSVGSGEAGSRGGSEPVHGVGPSPDGRTGGSVDGRGKVGVDDFLLEHGREGLEDLISNNLRQRSAFPRHPNTRDYVNKKLQRTHLGRQEKQALSMAILSDLDAKGSRLRSVHDGSTFYFDHDGRKLIRANFDMRQAFHESAFGIKLYKDYNLSAADAPLIQWLGAQFNGEAPISDVSPERVLAIRGDTFYCSLNDGQTVKASKDEVSVIDNGSDDVLFESGMVKESNATRFLEAVKYQTSTPAFPNQWYSVLQDARIASVEGDKVRRLLSYLYYISPWFYKWRGTQLPVEITTGEPGSGKSTLYQLRLDIITGVPNLRNAPSDMRDWGSSLAASGGLHVTDNVQLMDQSLRQKLSDELCRLVTEPNPAIEQRKLYTDNTIIRTPVKCVFAITAVKQPFTNVDIIQRAIITELDKGTDADLVYDDTWEEQQLTKFGGREGWLAHHMVFLQKFFRLVETDWNPRYKGKYRLTNMEQMLQLAARVFGEDGSWIPEFLSKDRDRRMSDTDWALEGIKEWIESVRLQWKEGVYSRRFYAGDIVEWAVDEEDFNKCQILQSSRSLGRYMQSHKHVIASTLNLVPMGKYGNKDSYGIRNPDGSRGK